MPVIRLYNDLYNELIISPIMRQMIIWLQNEMWYQIKLMERVNILSAGSVLKCQGR